MAGFETRPSGGGGFHLPAVPQPQPLPLPMFICLLLHFHLPYLGIEAVV